MMPGTSGSIPSRRLHRPCVWALFAALAILAINMASMRSAGPWDPWETHYGEVARNILVRGDPLDLWWQPGNAGPDARAEMSFASKPALPFWAMALSMRLFGVGTGSDPAQMVESPFVELALRLPSMLAGMLAAAFLGYVLWRLVSPRAGVLAGIVLATMPQWAIVTRQALTDMFFVAPVVLAAGAWALAWMQPDRPLRTRGRGLREVPWDRAYLGFVVAFVVAAVIPLAVVHHHGFNPWIWKSFGQFKDKAEGLRAIQVHMALYWVLVVAVVVRSLRWRRRSQAWMGILYLAAGVSLIGKGLIGPGLVGVFVLTHLVVSGRWNLLLRCELPIGILIFVLPAFPWHHAMALYRGERWVSELIIQNNLQRFSTGEQKQAVGGFAYYVETLGLAALPWSAVVPVALYRGFRRFAPEPEVSKPGLFKQVASVDSSAAAHQFMVLWFVVSLLVISYSTTKYYHYLLPVLPPLAGLIGIWLDRLWSNRSHGTVWGRGLGGLLGLALLVAVVRDAIHEPTWLAHLTTYLYTGMWTEGAPGVERLALVSIPFALGLGAWVMRRHRLAIASWVASGFLTTAYIIDDYIPAASESWSQRTAIQTYFDGRGPEDRLVSWWFYYRGETFFSKADIWVLRSPDRNALAELITEREGKGASLWFITTEPHAKRLDPQLPAKYRGKLEEVYRSYHYVMMRLRLD